MSKFRFPLRFTALATFAGTLLFGVPTAANAAFDIQLNFDSTVTAQQQAFFNTAAARWESIVVGYRAANSTITSLVIDASIPSIDGLGGTLGSAGPTQGRTEGGFTYATRGTMRFDSADVASLISSGDFGDVILHEMAHVMGFGTLWTNNGVYVTNNGFFTGANAAATYRREYNQVAAAGVPVELGGGTGTANGHWDEVDGGSALTGIVDRQGRDKAFELMTGWLNGNSYISDTTVASFMDIGYLVAPEPGTMALVGAGLLMGAVVVVRRRRKK